MNEVSGTAPLSAVQKPVEPPVGDTAKVDTSATDKGSASQTIDDGGKTSPKDATPSDSEPVRFLTLDDVPEEHRPYVEGILKEREKAMMAAYTKKTQDIAEVRKKAAMIDAFQQSPEATIRQVAQQMGFDVVPRGQQQAAQPNQPDQPWEPQTWDEVIAKAEERAEQRILTKLSPMLQPLYDNLQQVKSQTIENQLSQIDENWRIYEDDVKANMEFIKPDLLKTPDGIKKLYRMSVPEEVYTSKATQQAIKQYEAKIKAAQVSGASKINKATPSTGKITSFNDAVRAAKQMLNQT